MKIAVQFFGHLRMFDKCAKSVRRHLLSKYDCDVFMHTWNETEPKTKTWHNYNTSPQPVDNEKIETLKILYDLKDILVEKQSAVKNDILIPCQHNKGKTKISKAGMEFMLNSMNRVNELRKKYQNEHNIKYDYVLFIRPDIRLKNDFIIDNVNDEIKNIDNNTIRYCACNIPSSTCFPIIGNVASDIIFFSKPEIMDKTVEILNKIDFENHQYDMWNPETLFNQELEKEGISSHFINYQCNKDWEILRSPNKRNFRKDIISIKIRKNFFYLHLFGILPFLLISLKFCILGCLFFDICFGKRAYD